MLVGWLANCFMGSLIVLSFGYYDQIDLVKPNYNYVNIVLYMSSRSLLLSFEYCYMFISMFQNDHI